MAFVFRNQKKNSIVVPSKDIQSTIQQQKIKRYKSPGSLSKGLPSLINKPYDQIQKQNIFPDVEAHVIHHHEGLNTKSNGFRGREFIDTQINVELNQDVDVGEIITVKQIQNQTFSKIVGDKGEKKQQKDLHLKIKSIQKRKKVQVMNKNLLEVLQSKQKFKKDLGFQKIGIDKKEEKGQSILKNNKFSQWKSLKKLSPMKSFQQKFDKNSLQNLNIECKKSHDTLQPPNPKLKQHTKQKKPPKDHINKSLKTQTNSDEEQYVDQATPGPGYYSIQNWKNKKQFRSKKKKFQKLFFSNLQRFQKSPQKFQEVTYVNEDEVVNNTSFNNKKSSNCQSFLSKSPKLSNTELSSTPPIGYYDTRQSLQHDLVRNILKSSNTNTFINRSPRRYQVLGTNLPGPGAYTLDQSQQKLLEQKDLCTFSYKSNLQRKLDYHLTENKEQNGQISGLVSMHIGKNRQQSLIHVKQDSIIEDFYISQPPPFMSSSQRFPKIKIINKKAYEKSPSPIEKPVSPKKPFNSSSQRKIDHIVGEGVGVGAYNSTKKQWQKRSFNVLFN